MGEAALGDPRETDPTRTDARWVNMVPTEASTCGGNRGTKEEVSYLCKNPYGADELLTELADSDRRIPESGSSVPPDRRPPGEFRA